MCSVYCVVVQPARLYPTELPAPETREKRHRFEGTGTPRPGCDRPQNSPERETSRVTRLTCAEQTAAQKLQGQNEYCWLFEGHESAFHMHPSAARRGDKGGTEREQFPQ